MSSMSSATCALVAGAAADAASTDGASPVVVAGGRSIGRIITKFVTGSDAKRVVVPDLDAHPARIR